MCGIAGCNFLTDNKAAFAAMNHRGPDASQVGYFGKYTLGHNRLSIIDLSENANQPFTSADGNYVMVFNGEVYNYQEVRKKLEHKYVFKTSSDTEVILNSYLEYGEKCVHEFIGMFAFAIYDVKKDELFCARDRLGIKPFNYYWEKGKFIFSSEIKTILQLLDNKPEVNQEAIFQYLRYLYIPAPNSIFKGIKKLMPGHTLTIKGNDFRIQQFWDASDFIGKNNQIKEPELLERLDDLLDSSIRLRMIADVELGSFLSGGIDSSAILYYMAKHSSRPVNTYTLGFKDAPLYDETSDARLMAAAFKTNHHEILISPNAANLLPTMVSHFDEPFGNPTALLIHELTKETRKYATVALAGDGGDEIFGGYPRYEACLLYNKLKRVPKFLFKTGSAISNVIPENSSGNHTLRRAKVFINSMSKNKDDMYEDWIGYFSDQEIKDLASTYSAFGHSVKEVFNNTPTDNLIIKSSLTDLKTFLPNNLLSYGDIMSMANSFEVRVPLIDHRIIELMTSVKSEFRIKDGITKYSLKKLLKGKIPDSIINKPKLGLNPPMGIWLKKDLQPFIAKYLSPGAIQKRGLFRSEFIQKIIREHQSNKKDRSLYIWSLIVLEEWFQQYID